MVEAHRRDNRRDGRFGEPRRGDPVDGRPHRVWIIVDKRDKNGRESRRIRHGSCTDRGPVGGTDRFSQQQMVGCTVEHGA